MKKIFSKSIEYLAAVSTLCAKVFTSCFAIIGLVVFIDPSELTELIIVEGVEVLNMLIKLAFICSIGIWFMLFGLKAVKMFDEMEKRNRWKRLLVDASVHVVAFALVFLAIQIGGTIADRSKMIFALILPGVAIRIVQRVVSDCTLKQNREERSKC